MTKSAAKSKIDPASETAGAQTAPAETAGGGPRSFKVEFRFRNSTPGAHRYEEIGPDGAVLAQKDALIGQLYLRKSAVGDAPIAFLSLDIKAHQ